MNRTSRSYFHLPLGTLVGLAIAALVVVVSTAFAYRSLQGTMESSREVVHTLDLLERLQQLLSDVKDAETSQRGFLLTGVASYLVPYNAAQATVPAEVTALRSLVADTPQQAARAAALGPLVVAKMDELRETVTLRRDGEEAGALAIVRTDRGKVAMDAIRSIVGEMQKEERQQLATHQDEYQEAVRSSFRYTLVGALALLSLIAFAGWLFARSHREREVETWLRAGTAGVDGQLLGDHSLQHLADRVLSILARYVDAPLAMLYVTGNDGRFTRLAGFAVDSVDRDAPLEVLEGSGLLGQVARDRLPLHVRDVPRGYAVHSTLGRAAPRELLLAPAVADGEVHAVMEFAFLKPVEARDRELMERVSESIAVAIRSLRERQRIDDLLAETQRQGEEMQTQQEELRVSNEELEEQGNALKASQLQLENQQAELEQTNAHLADQAERLEEQRDALTRSQTVLADKARELERSNQYKSEFLANMSHELRTPLNSTLILAKLLADNKQGNLTAEQVRFAETISSAGNDLLLLINDILDLSKIEARKVEVDAGPVVVARLVDALVKTFDPIAKDKGLVFEAVIEPGAPAQLRSDAQRVAQILRNLLSNAFKFTEKGRVSLRVSADGDARIAMAVGDSGIGVSTDQKDIIFEAFRQADGSTHRRFGGTGLGLSISRDLARLLGGDIDVQSTPGQGSVFRLSLPIDYEAREAVGPPAPAEAAEPTPRTAPPAPIERPTVRAARPAAAPTIPAAAGDDSRLILVIEDDVRFAAILDDLAREMGFRCIVAHNAADGLAAAVDARPSAIVLDMNLPDYSGLGVLDQLKRNPATRHIPVHVASVADHSREARELGAVGYDLKPVARERLAEAFEGLRARFAQQLRRVLVVEDDERQLASMRTLLANDDVRIVGVARAADALEQLQSTTFDCMVMDLNLPDLSGYDLLEQMAAREDVAFPPVIVYTGRTLTRDEEQRLGRYSRSIIVKDVRSPERLLDEVTLFLHQVEADLPPERQRMLREARSREATLENRRVLVVEDDVRNIFALTSVLEPKGLRIQIARNGREAIEALDRSATTGAASDEPIDLVLMDIMMPEMDGYTAMREIRKDPRWKKLPIIALTAKAMRDDQEKCLEAGASDYIAKPLDVEKLLSLVRVWMPK